MAADKVALEVQLKQLKREEKMRKKEAKLESKRYKREAKKAKKEAALKAKLEAKRAQVPPPGELPKGLLFAGKFPKGMPFPGELPHFAPNGSYATFTPKCAACVIPVSVARTIFPAWQRPRNCFPYTRTALFFDTRKQGRGLWEPV